MGYEMTIYVDNYAAIEYDHPYFYTIIKDYKKEKNIPQTEIIYTVNQMKELRDFCYKEYIKNHQDGFDYEYDGERYFDLIRDISYLLRTFPSIPRYKIHHNQG